MKYYYLFHLQYLGFRYHGWQKQTEHKSIQAVLESCFKQFLNRDDFQILVASRTDSMVSVQHSFFELIVPVELTPKADLEQLNYLLPPDIKILSWESVDKHFSIINAPKIKEYLYFFSWGEKNHPFAAPFITHINEELDLELMALAAGEFVGRHHFFNFCYKPRENQKFEKTILVSEVIKNDLLTASFFPEKSFVYRVKAESFMRHQVRMMMGSIFKIGMGEMKIAELRASLSFEADHSQKKWPSMIAPASGLILNQITLR